MWMAILKFQSENTLQNAKKRKSTENQKILKLEKATPGPGFYILA